MLSAKLQPSARALIALCGALALALPSLAQAKPTFCKSFKTGDYRLINPRNPVATDRGLLFKYDATTMVATFPGGATVQLTPTADECAFTTPDGQPVVVSRAGMFLARIADAYGEHLALGMPETTSPLDSLAGRWNTFGTVRGADGEFHQSNSQAIIEPTGEIKPYYCGDDGLDECVRLPASGMLSANPEGGFNLTMQGVAEVQRAFLYRKGDGAVLAVVGGDKLQIYTPQARRDLPRVDGRTVQWSLSQDATGTAGALTTEHRVIVSIDEAKQTFVRKVEETCVAKTYFINAGRNGMNYVGEGAGHDCADNIVPIDNMNLMVTNLGLSVFGWESVDSRKPRYFGLSLSHP
jgi:hypothetical protein